MFRFDEKTNKIVREDIEKIEVNTDTQDIIIETDEDGLTIDIENKVAEYNGCDGNSCEFDGDDEIDYTFFQDLNPEVDIDDIPAKDSEVAEDSEGTEDEDIVEEGLFGKSKREKTVALGTLDKGDRFSKDGYKYLVVRVDGAQEAFTVKPYGKQNPNDDINSMGYVLMRGSDSVVKLAESSCKYKTTVYENDNKLKGYKIQKQNNYYKVTDDNGVALDIDFESEDAAKEYINTISDADLNETKSIKESADGTYSMRMYDYIDTLSGESAKALCYAFTKWLTDDDVNDFARRNDLVLVFEDRLDTDLPTSVEIEASELYCDFDDNEDIEDAISNYLSDTYGFCHYGYNYDLVRNEAGIVEEVSVYDIEWDLSESKSIKESCDESVNPNDLTDCPECGDTSFDSKRGRCTKCSYREWLDESKSIKEDVGADDEVIIGLYGDEVSGFDSVDQLAKSFEDNGIEVLHKSGDMEYGWDLEVKGNARDIYRLVNGKITGYNCNSTEEFVDRYRIDESKYIKEALTVADFVDWHETASFTENESTFEAIYNILNKYPDADDDVRNQYAAASEEDKEAITKLIDGVVIIEEPEIYLARALHTMLINDWDYQRISEELGIPVSEIMRLVGPSSYDESLKESAEKQYVAIDTQDKDNKDNNRKYTEKQLIDFAKELIKIEEESSEPEQYKNRPELKDDLASAKKVLKYFMYDVREASEDIMN